MKPNMLLLNLLPFLAIIAFPCAAQAESYTYTSDGSAITITGYTGTNAVISVPDTIEGLPVTSLANLAFYNKSDLLSITIPKSVTNIGMGVFFLDASLTNITVATSNSTYSSIGGILFDKSQTTLIQCPEGFAGSYEIPAGVTNIMGGAFGRCAKLTDVIICSGITSIVDGMFSFCTDLNAVIIPSGVTNIGSSAFFNCSSLTNVTLPDSVISIEESAFEECTGLTSVIIGKDCTSIGVEAFRDCNSLTNLTIPDSDTSIGGRAFYSCISLASVTIGNGDTFIGGSAFEKCSKLASVSIGNGASSIEGSAFFACTNLTSVSLGNGVTRIGNNAFGACFALTSINIPEGVTSLGDSALSSCFALDSITIPASVTSLGSGTFNYCTNLTSLYFQGKGPRADNLFYKAVNVTVYYKIDSPGWGTTYGGRPTVLWNPLIETSDESFGVGTNGFGFNITETESGKFVVKTCTNIADDIWIPIQTNTMSGGAAYFSDPVWINYPNRYYRLTMP